MLFALPDHRVLERYRYLIGLTGVGLLLITMIFGTRINGARLWIEIGGGQTMQLGEVAKVLIVIFLAAYLRDKRELLAVPTRRVWGVPTPPMSALGPVLVFLAACLGLVVVLNDFGTALLFLGVFLAMIYLASGRAAYTVFGLAVFLVGSAAVYTVVPRIESRVQNWLTPVRRRPGPGLPARPVALRPGRGRGAGARARAAPSWCAATARRWCRPCRPTSCSPRSPPSSGYIGGVGILLGFLVLIQRGFVIAANANDGFSKLLAGGLTATIGLQAILIIGGVIRLIPLDRRDPALHELRRVERGDELRPGGAAADHQPPLRSRAGVARPAAATAPPRRRAARARA